jgi:hypothetical protein
MTKHDTREEEIHVRRKILQLTLGVLIASAVTIVGRAAQPPQLIGVCGSAPNLPMVYFSGVLQGSATAFQGYQADFNRYLTQRYGYKGAVGCLPAATASIAQNIITTRAAALRSGKKTVIETGWTESAAAPAAPVAPAATIKAQSVVPAAAALGRGAAPGATTGGSGANGSAQMTNVLNSLLGAAGSTAGGASGAKVGAGKAGTALTGAGAGSGSSGAQNSMDQISSLLSGVLANKTGGAGSTQDVSPPKSPPQALPDGALGMAQSPSSKLVVFGCGRQDLRVACVTELTNQNQNDTLVQSADAWKDAFIVDDRGDRHQRTNGFFLNIDGDQRQQIDISYGKSARFILVFDGVPAKVDKVALRSAAGGLDVEDIHLIAPNAAPASR